MSNLILLPSIATILSLFLCQAMRMRFHRARVRVRNGSDEAGRSRHAIRR